LFGSRRPLVTWFFLFSLFGAVAIASIQGCSAGSSAATASSVDAAGHAVDAAGAPNGAEVAAPNGAEVAAPNGSNTVASHTVASVDAPGRYLTSATDVAAATGPCAGKTLGSLLDAIRAANPELAAIETIYSPQSATSDGAFIYAYARSDGGFDVVFKRGLGDCLAGCTENDYQYFSTDAACHPTLVGHYHTAWGAGTCLTVSGTPLWTHPLPPDPLTVCGQDNTPRDIRGTYALHGVGQRTPCSVGAVVASSVDAVVGLVVEQSAGDLSSGFVTFTSTGDPLVDGVRLPARFQRRRFDAASMSSRPPSTCPRVSTVTARYDFEYYQPGGIDAADLGDDACSACKGSLSLALTEGP